MGWQFGCSIGTEMVRILSKRLGPIEFDESAIVEFAAGLPGFQHCTRMAVVQRPASIPLVYLQSLDFPDICFLTIPVSAVIPDYQLEMTPEDLKCIGLASSGMNEDILCLAILAPAEGGRFTVNLLAPVVIHRGASKGVQAVRVDTRYSHQHPLGGAGATCS
jgi:flagellar assembly factor FliW